VINVIDPKKPQNVNVPINEFIHRTIAIIHISPLMDSILIIVIIVIIVIIMVIISLIKAVLSSLAHSHPSTVFLTIALNDGLPEVRALILYLLHNYITKDHLFTKAFSIDGKTFKPKINITKYHIQCNQSIQDIQVIPSKFEPLS